MPKDFLGWYVKKATNGYINKKTGAFDKLMGLPPKVKPPKKRKVSKVKVDYTKRRSDVIKKSLKGWKAIK